MPTVNVYSPDYNNNGTPKPSIPELKDAIENARVDAESFATATGSFTVDGTTYQKGAKGWAADAEGYKNTAQSEAASAASDASDAAESASTAQGVEDTVVGRTAEETRSHGRPAHDDLALRYILDFYANTRRGDDARSGISAPMGFKTLSKLEAEVVAAGTPYRAGIMAGTYNAEKLTLAGEDTIVAGLSRSPADLVPFIDCSSDLPDGDWSLASNQNNTYVQTRPEPTTNGASDPRVWEDDTELTKQTSIADVDANAGSFYVNTGSDPWEIYVHPRNSTDPTSDGKLYEWTSTSHAVVTTNAGRTTRRQTIRGVHGRRPLLNGGALVVGPDSIIERCMTEDGGKHHLIVGGGLVRDVVCYNTSPNRGITSGADIQYFNGLSSSDQPVDAENIILLHSNAQGLNLTNHTGFRAANVKGVVSLDHDQPLNLTEGSETKGLYCRATRNVFSGKRDQTLKYALIDTLGDSTGTTAMKEGPLVVENSILYSGQLTRRLEAGDSITARHCIIAGSPVFKDLNSNGSLTIENSIIINAAFFESPSQPGNGLSGDHCIFLGDGKNEVRAFGFKGALSDFQSNNSDFANSAFVTGGQWDSLLLGNWLAGDVRINPNAEVTDASGGIHKGQLPDGTDIQQVGPQKKWNWGARHEETGPPSQWPTPPETRDECRRYVTAPSAHSWNDEPYDHREKSAISEDLLHAWEMDESADADETDEINSLTLTNGSGVGSGSTSDYPYRTYGSSSSHTANVVGSELISNNKYLWVAAPIRPTASGDILRLYRSVKPAGILLKWTGSEFRFRLALSDANTRNIEADISISGNGAAFQIVQIWHDPFANKTGMRVGGTEKTQPNAIEGYSYEDTGFTDTLTVGGFEGDIGGPLMWAHMSPSKEARDWLANNGAYRGLSPIQSRREDKYVFGPDTAP